MTGAESSVLQYGALGLLAIVLVAIAAFLRETARREGDRLLKRDEFLEALFQRVTNNLDAVVEAQHQTAVVLTDVSKSINGHADKSSAEHSQILACAKRRSTSGKVGP